MERLLADAEKLSGVKYDINNLGDVYDAIHVIQEDLGLTGVAAQEASETFTGSFNAMKAAAQNFFGSLALGENVNESLGTLISSVTTFLFDNLIPMVGTVIQALPGAIFTFLQQGIPALLSNLSTLIGTIATQIQTFASGITAEKVATWAQTMLPQIISSAATIIGNFVVGLITNLPKIIVAINQIAGEIIKGLGSAIWGKVREAANGIKDRFLEPINKLRDKVRGIIDKIKGFFKFKISAPNVPLPHFSISPAGWKLKDLLKGSIPKLSIRWFAEGGIVDGPTLFGAGEKGPEAIVPLDKLWDRLEKVSTGETNIVININGATGDPKEIAEEVKRSLIQETNRRRLAWQ